MEKAVAPHSSTLAWKIPWKDEPGGLQSMGSLKVGHDWATSLSLFTFIHWRRKWQPTPVFLPGESQGRGAWWAAVYGVTQSQTRLKWLSSSSILLLLLCFMYKSEYIVDLVCNLFTWSVIFTAFILHFLCLKIKILDLKKRSLYYSVCGCFIKYLRNKLLGSDVQNCLHNSFSRLSRSCFLTSFSLQSHVGFQR